MTNPPTLSVVTDEQQAIAQAQADADATILANLQDRDGVLTAPEPEPETQTIGSAFRSSVQLIAETKREFRLSEQTLVKMWELNLMWVIQNRQQEAAQPTFGPEDVERIISEGSGERITGIEE